MVGFQAAHVLDEWFPRLPTVHSIPDADRHQRPLHEAVRPLQVAAVPQTQDGVEEQRLPTTIQHSGGNLVLIFPRYKIVDGDAHRFHGLHNLISESLLTLCKL